MPANNIPRSSLLLPNPTVTLTGPVRDGCLHESDGMIISGMFQAARSYTLCKANTYRKFIDQLNSDPGAYAKLYHSQPGMMVLMHTTGTMYSYWLSSPNGDSIFHGTLNGIRPEMNVTDIFRNEAAPWGTFRLNASPHADLYVVDDTPHGSVVVDEHLKHCFLVIGLMHSPAKMIRNMGITLPAQTRLTAVPFRGVLVYDGLLGTPRPVPHDLATRVRKLYRNAKTHNNIIRGFKVPPPDTFATVAANTDVGLFSTASDGADDALPAAWKRVQDAAKQVRVVDDTFLLFRRFAYTEKENPNHIVALMEGAKFVGMFMSAELEPTADEVLEEIAKLAGKGTLPKIVQFDHFAIVKDVRKVLRPAGITVGHYPIPSSEEQNFLTIVPPAILKTLEDFSVPA